MTTVAEFPPPSLPLPEDVRDGSAGESLTYPGAILPNDWRYAHGIGHIGNPISKLVHCHSETIGMRSTSKVIMDDGSEYVVHDGHPTRQLSDIAVAKTTAYMTRHDRGMNVHHQNREMKLGLRSILISRETASEEPVNQVRTAYNMARIIKAFIEGDDEVDPNTVILKGISRAAQEALIVKALTDTMPELGLDCPWFNLDAPCYPRSLVWGLRYAMFPLCEGLSLATHSLQLPKHLLTKYPGTVDWNPNAIAAGARALTTGEAGDAIHYISQDPAKTHGYMFVMPDDVMGMGKVWKQDFAHHAGVNVEIAPAGWIPLSNGHLRVMSYQDLLQSQERDKRFAEQRPTTGNVADLDFGYIHTGKLAA